MKRKSKAIIVSVLTLILLAVLVYFFIKITKNDYNVVYSADGNYISYDNMLFLEEAYYGEDCDGKSLLFYNKNSGKLSEHSLENFENAENYKFWKFLDVNVPLSPMSRDMMYLSDNLAVIDKRATVYYKINGEKEIEILNLENAAFSKISTDGKYIAVITEDGKLAVYTKKNGKYSSETVEEVSGKVSFVTWINERYFLISSKTTTEVGVCEKILLIDCYKKSAKQLYKKTDSGENPVIIYSGLFTAGDFEYDKDSKNASVNVLNIFENTQKAFTVNCNDCVELNILDVSFDSSYIVAEVVSQEGIKTVFVLSEDKQIDLCEMSEGNVNSVKFLHNNMLFVNFENNGTKFAKFFRLTF